jgi:hypothetical protein
MLRMTSGAGIDRFQKCDLSKAQRAMNMSKQQQTWRSRLTRDIGWSLFIKLGLLTLLWALFFSNSHRCRVDGVATASRLALEDNGIDSCREPQHKENTR